MRTLRALRRRVKSFLYGLWENKARMSMKTKDSDNNTELAIWRLSTRGALTQELMLVNVALASAFGAMSHSQS